MQEGKMESAGGQGGSQVKKIMAMVGVSIAVFLGVSAFQLSKSMESKSTLTDVEELYFPILIKADSSLSTMDKVNDDYLKAVMGAESDEAKATHGLGLKVVEELREMGRLYPAKSKEIGSIEKGFADYNEETMKFAEDYIAKRIEGSQLGEKSKLMNQHKSEVRERLKAFRDSAAKEFSQSLADTKSAMQLNLYLSLALGLMNLGFMGVLVYFIRSNVAMMAQIADQNANLERRVAERTEELAQKTNDINAMLQNMKLGVCAISPGNLIHPEYSAHMNVIFGTDPLANKEVIDALFAKAKIGADLKDQISVGLSAIIGEDEMMFDCNGHLLPREMELEMDGERKILQMDWSPIHTSDGAVDKVLMISQDVTHLRELELEAAHQREELAIISQIIKISIGKFNEFISSSRKYLADNRALVLGASGKDEKAVAALFRNMHTVKGNARTYEFKMATDAAHEAEMAYDKLRKDESAPWDPQGLLAGIAAVESALDHYVDVNENVLGRKGRASDLLTTRGTFVSNEELEQLRSLASKAGSGTELSLAISRLGLIPLERLVSGAIDSLSSLSKELGKPAPRLELSGEPIAFNNRFAEALKGSLMHMVRNSLDHGIESPEARSAVGKDERGLISLSAAREGSSIALRLRDDGRGLALAKLKAKGFQADIFATDSLPDASEIAELIFNSGLSTAESLTQVSGRGVGMDAVRSFLAEHGATIEIELDSNDPSAQFVGFGFKITAPDSTAQAGA